MTAIVASQEAGAAKIHYMIQNLPVSPANEQQLRGIKQLLQSERLPVDDLPASPDNFFVVNDDASPVAAIGLEQYGHFGLLRSLVVLPGYRKMKIAESLVSQVEARARELGLTAVYLLTETAPGYFSRLGYEPVKREEAPAAIRVSSEFSHVCPASAILMRKTFQ